MPVIGRGGVGNIQAAQENSRKSTDLEANRPSHDGAVVQDATELERHKEKHELARVGRGGSGNYHVPSELQKAKHSEDNPGQSLFADKLGLPDVGQPNAQQLANKGTILQAPRTYGRGGAGNVAYLTSSQDTDEAQQRQRKLKADVEDQVTLSLAVPAKAKLGGINFGS